MVVASENSAALACWVCTALSIFILLLRLASNYVRKELANATSYLAVLSIFVDLTRAIVNIYILEYNTVGDLVDILGRIPHGIELQHAQLASKLSLVARLLITSFYWLQCSILLLTYRHFLNHIRWVGKAIWVCWFLIGSTYVAVILTTLLECQPLSLNWTPSETPNHCVFAYAQLLVQCVSNICIDMMLLVISIPIWRNQPSLSWQKNLRLGLLFSLGLFCIIVTCVRCWQTFDTKSSQVTRSMWASLQGTVAAFVANAVALYGGARVFYRNLSGRRSSSVLRTDSNMQNLMGPDAYNQTHQRSNSHASRNSMAHFGVDLT